METESLRLLRDRRSELQERLDELRARIGPVEFELKQIDAAIVLMTSVRATGAEASRNSVAHITRLRNPGVEHLTIKELVLKALDEHLPNGATSQDFLEVFAREWGRNDIKRTSLSPQLTRLKSENKLVMAGRVWVRPKELDKHIGEQVAEMFAHENEPSNGKPEDGSEIALEAQTKETTEC